MVQSSIPIVTNQTSNLANLDNNIKSVWHENQDQDGLIECCEKELVGRAAKLVAGGGVSLGWTGRSAVWLV